MAEDDAKAGRHPKYSDPLHFENCIDQYFDQCETDKRIPTVAGLAYHMGFASRQSLWDYEQKKEFSYAATRARLRIEQDRSERLIDREKYTPGLAMDLASNHNWTTARTETDASVTVKDAARSLDAKLSKYADADTGEGAPEESDA
ncbi:terminase small subunit [Henriciella sp.]|uniref:terminase small subunit n=1 Tax=Henriciella sp. TaxID=1968823 RepID=UPI0025B8DCB3|nr:terminase small subunit [Henriciella sp.]